MERLTTKEQIEVIRAAVIKAVPEIMNRPRLYKSIRFIDDNLKNSTYPFIGKALEGDDFEPVDVIRLADVLLAIQKKTINGASYYVTDTGVFSQIGGKYCVTWNLHDDSLSEQSPECITFLVNLLAPNK